MRRVLRLCLASVAICWAAYGAGNRYALVIGNQKYPKETLCASGNDATDLAARLGELGFDVDERHDTDYATLSAALDQFKNRIQAQDTVLFFYAGHGMDVGGQNYLLPVDYSAKKVREVGAYAIPVARVTEALRRAGSALLIMDACRRTGLAYEAQAASMSLITPPENTLVVYSASPSQKASDDCDGKHPNGLFTRHLLHQMEKLAGDTDKLLLAVKADVAAESKQRQVPVILGKLKKPFILSIKVDCVETPKNPNSPRDLLQAAECLLRNDSAFKAADLAEKVTQLQPKNAEAWWLLGQAKIADGFPQEGKEALQKAVDLDPTHPQYRFTLGSLLLDDEPEKALAQLKEAYDQARDFPGLCAKLAEAYEQTKNTRVAQTLRASCR